jgi:hypothetical protein
MSARHCFSRLVEKKSRTYIGKSLPEHLLGDLRSAPRLAVGHFNGGLRHNRTSKSRFLKKSVRSAASALNAT